MKDVILRYCAKKFKFMQVYTTQWEYVIQNLDFRKKKQILLDIWSQKWKSLNSRIHPKKNTKDHSQLLWFIIHNNDIYFGKNNFC